MKDDFCRWEEFDKSSRTAAHSDIGVIELMPVADGVNYGFKYVNGHPSNPNVGMSTVMAFGALSDVSTGYPRLLSELTLSTALRTSVTSVMAAQALANPHATSMGMIGCGAQSEFQAIAFHTIIGIKELRIFDIDHQAMNKVAEHLKDYPELTVIKASSAKACVEGADIVTTVTADKAYATILTPDMIEPVCISTVLAVIARVRQRSTSMCSKRVRFLSNTSRKLGLKVIFSSYLQSIRSIQSGR